MSTEKDCLIEEYNKRLKLAESERQDEQWFRDAMQVISDGAFSCYGQGKYLHQEKGCSWNTIYELLSKLNGVDATIQFKITSNDLSIIGDEYKSNSIIQSAISKGWIQMNAALMDDKSVRLYKSLDWDAGDSGNFGRWTINLMAYIAQDGSFNKPFYVVDTRIW